MKAIIIGILTAIGIFDVLLIYACMVLESDYDRAIDDEEQIRWLAEYREKKRK